MSVAGRALGADPRRPELSAALARRLDDLAVRLDVAAATRSPAPPAASEVPRP